MCELTTALLVASTVMGGAGVVQTAAATAQSNRYNAKVAEANAKIADQAAQDALERGKLEEQKQRRATAQLMGQQQAAMAANGVDLSFGSPLDTLVDTAMLGELDALTIRTNTSNEVRDILQQGSNYRSQAGMSRAAASSALTGGAIKAAGTVLGGSAEAYTQGVKAGVF